MGNVLTAGHVAFALEVVFACKCRPVSSNPWRLREDNERRCQSHARCTPTHSGLPTVRLPSTLRGRELLAPALSKHPGQPRRPACPICRITRLIVGRLLTAPEPGGLTGCIHGGSFRISVLGRTILDLLLLRIKPGRLPGLLRYKSRPFLRFPAARNLPGVGIGTWRSCRAQPTVIGRWFSDECERRNHT